MHDWLRAGSWYQIVSRSISPRDQGGKISSSLIHFLLRFITFGARSAHLAHHVPKSGRKTSIIIWYDILQGPRTETLRALGPNRSDQLKAKTCTSQVIHTQQIRRTASHIYNKHSVKNGITHSNNIQSRISRDDTFSTQKHRTWLPTDRRVDENLMAID